MNPQRRFINTLRSGEVLDQVFLVREKDLRTTKSGDLYLTLNLADRTGQIPARLWQATESIYKGIPIEGFLQVKGRVEDYRGSLQIIIDACRPWASDRVDLGDFLAVTPCDIEAMWAELTEITRAIKDRHLRMLIKKFVEDQNIVSAYKRSPAAMQMHHAYIGGLLEHTLGVARAAQALLPLYPKVNADLVLAGVFLHDVGKTAELSAGVAVSYTDRGQLVGHVTIAAIWIAEKARLVAEETGEGFPAPLVDLLQHIVLSHHGQYEFGSPKLPAIPEAFFVHYLDNLDAKIWMTHNAIESDPDPASSFTAFNRALETRLFKHSAAGGEGAS